MRKIWKFNLVPEIVMPKGAKILSIGTQGPDMCIWALVDPEEATETRCFWLAGTGHDVPEFCKFIGRITQGPFEWHIFESDEGSPAVEVK